jgi:hypothetical protein
VQKTIDNCINRSPGQRAGRLLWYESLYCILKNIVTESEEVVKWRMGGPGSDGDMDEGENFTGN